jgi:organic hydroperoxide reductase OsmC/OhrA
MIQETVSKPAIKHKVFNYQTQLESLGGRAGFLSAEGKPGFRVASPPEFKGEAGVWTPEDLFVASVNICTMTTFAALAARQDLTVISYRSDSQGTLEFVDGKYRFTKIVLLPVIEVATQEDKQKAKTVLEDAHRTCLIANSMSTEVLLEPQIRIV